MQINEGSARPTEESDFLLHEFFLLTRRTYQRENHRPKVVISGATEGLIPGLNFRNVEEIKVEGGIRTDFLNPVNPILICQGNERYTYRLVWEYPPRLSLDFGSHSQASASVV